MNKPNIVILESIHDYGINELKKVANVEVLLGLSREEILLAVQNAHGIIVKSVVEVNKELFNCAPKLKFVGRAGTGLDNVDVKLAKEMDITLLSTPTANSISAAELTVTFILSSMRRLPEVFESVKQNDFRRAKLEGNELSGKKVGIIGIGNVGIRVFKRLLPFGCKIYGYDPDSIYLQDFIDGGGIIFNTLKDLFNKVEILSLHANLQKGSRHILNRDTIKFLNKGSVLINTARAGLIEDNALLDALQKGLISWAMLDVLSPEPPYDLLPEEHRYQHKLLSHPRVTVTPHIGASTIEAQTRVAEELVDALKKYYN